MAGSRDWKKLVPRRKRGVRVPMNIGTLDFLPAAERLELRGTSLKLQSSNDSVTDGNSNVSAAGSNSNVHLFMVNPNAPFPAGPNQKKLKAFS